MKNNMESNKFVLYPNIGSIYQHYKGGKYTVITMATHSETNEPMVIYRSELFGSIYARPLTTWFEVIDVKKNITRFSEL